MSILRNPSRIPRTLLFVCLATPAMAQLDVIEDCNLNGIEDVFDAVNCPGDLDGDAHRLARRCW